MNSLSLVLSGDAGAWVYAAIGWALLALGLTAGTWTVGQWVIARERRRQEIEKIAIEQLTSVNAGIGRLTASVGGLLGRVDAIDQRLTALESDARDALKRLAEIEHRLRTT